jgi:hypothetical protein
VIDRSVGLAPASTVPSSKRENAINGRAVRTTARWFVGLVAILHGSIHFLGAAKGLGWANVTQLTDPISTGLGTVWFATAVFTIATGALLLARIRWWWIVGAVSVVISQTVIGTSWADAKAGTIANVVLAGPVIYGWASQGRHGARAVYRRQASNALAAHRVTNLGTGADLVTEADLARLPACVAAYIRRSGALGRPRVLTLRARFHGRIRSDPTKPWMTFTGEQVNTYGPQPSRLFLMDAELLGLPVEVLHAFTAGAATMRVRALSLFTMVDASGPEMDRAETVTLFNDLCVLAPAALIDAPVTWTIVDDQHVRGSYTYGVNTITAGLIFNAEAELVDFVSDDRTAASTDGKTLTPQRWSTPISRYRNFGSRRLGTIAEAHWHPPGGEFAYLEYNLDDITYNTTDLTPAPTAGHS